MTSNLYQEKIAKILRIPKKNFAELVLDLEKITGKVGIIEKVLFENEQIVSDKLAFLGVSHNSSASEVYDALISKVEADDLKLLNIIGHGSLRGYEASRAVVNFIEKIHINKSSDVKSHGFFLKKEKAKHLLIAEPPKKIMEALGYSHVADLVEKEDLLEIYSALRFLEDAEWQNKVFFKQYEGLKPEDFEKRPIELRALNQKWAEAATKFVTKKHHNVSHLKELGVIFVIPTFLGISGETLRLVSLLCHYVHEVTFYSGLFEKFAKDYKTFSSNLISVLRGDVVERRLSGLVFEARHPRFLVIQRYLSKDDQNDWRLFEPHVNPEALHWQKAEGDIARMNHDGLKFWEGLGWVGDFFKTDVGIEALISFDLVDTVMSLVKQKEMARYLYHHQEALWNKIFIEYFGEEKLEQLSGDNIVRGWFEV